MERNIDLSILRKLPELQTQAVFGNQAISAIVYGGRNAWFFLQDHEISKQEDAMWII